MKKFWKILIIVLLVLLVLAGGYVAYVFLDYHRIPDNQTLDVYEQEPQPIAQTGQEYRVLTWNIGFGAYEDDYGFFMDGGTESWAWSEDRLKANLAEISNVLLNEAADIYFCRKSILIRRAPITSTSGRICIGRSRISASSTR